MTPMDDREVIPAGEQWGWQHLAPIAKFLIERGHPAIYEEFEYGFFDSPGGFQCKLGRPFTREDWTAINQRFLVPESIVFFHGLIRDNINGIDMVGIGEITEHGKRLTFDEWEERERRAGRRS